MNSSANNHNGETVNYLLKATSHLKKLVDDTLDFSKLRSNQFKLIDNHFLLEEQIDEIEALFQSQAQEKGIFFKIQKQGAFSNVLLGDSVRLKQIIINLISNAIKFTENGEVVLLVDAQQTSSKFQLSVKVTDTGKGIADKDIDRIFNEFEQVDHMKF